MPRIAGVDIPADKPIWVSLSYIYGIGPANARVILKEAAIDAQRRAKELGAVIIGEIVDLGKGRGLYQWIRDREGNLIGLWGPS